MTGQRSREEGMNITNEPSFLIAKDVLLKQDNLYQCITILYHVPNGDSFLTTMILFRTDAVTVLKKTRASPLQTLSFSCSRTLTNPSIYLESLCIYCILFTASSSQK